MTSSDQELSSSDQPPALLGYPTIGVGVSAASIATLSELLSHLGRDPGIAVVIVHQHLGPDHASSLVEILGRVTPLEVVTASAGTRVDANCLYVAPPNARLTITGGVLQLTSSGQSVGAIDQFFVSLAADQGRGAVGVLLTGAGASASQGLRAIEREGGTTIVQDTTRESAAADGENRVLSPATIAQQLLQLGHRSATLCTEVLSHVPGFFRDPALFDALETSAYDKLLAEQPRRGGLRVWVPDCSTGEEVYSIAISLLEYLEEHDAGSTSLTLFGTDVSLSAIEKARTGNYDKSIERAVSAARLQRFFVKNHGGYQIRKEVRRHCVFARHNATRDPPFSALDLISCRNSLIHSDSALRERLLPIFHYALREPGYLLMAPSDTVHEYPGFEPFDAKHEIYARAGSAPRLPFCFADPQPSLPSRSFGLSALKPSDAVQVLREADRLLLTAFAPPGVVVSDDLSIVQLRGKTGPFLDYVPGVASFDLMRRLRAELRLPVRELIDEARVHRVSVRRKAVQLDQARTLEIEVIPFGPPVTAQRFFIILFKELPLQAADAESFALQGPNEQLAAELRSTRAYLQAVIEQFGTSNEELCVANEEVISSNEELRSTNEALQMAKEELQATNEELQTLNDDINIRNLEMSRLNDDFSNILSSVEIPIVIVGRDLRVRRFTPAAARMLNLTSDDVGRMLTDIRISLDVPDLVKVIMSVFERLVPAVRLVRDSDGCSYQLVVRPYLTTDKRVDGTVISIFDLEEATRGASPLAHAYAETVLDTVGECLVLVDFQLRVLSTNRAFQRTFKLEEKAAEGRRLSELGSGVLDASRLGEALLALRPGEKLEAYRLESTHAEPDKRIFTLNARRIEQRDTILLALTDITEAERAGRAVEQAEHGFREMLMNAGQAITMTDSEGAIVFANHKAAEAFGYSLEELRTLSSDALVPERLRAAHKAQRADFLRHPHHADNYRDLKTLGLRKDGSEFPKVVHLGTMIGDGRPLVVRFITDITQQQVAEQQIREYQARLRRTAFDAAVAEERERRRIAADLHDGIGQTLALAQIKLTGLRDAVTDSIRTGISEVIELLAKSVLDTRTLTFELSPPMLYDLGIKDALSWLAEEVEKRQGVQIELSDDDAPKVLDESTAALVYRAVRELIMNVFKHSRVTTAKVSLRREQDDIEIDVIDAGVGFAAGEPASLSPPIGFGLFNVREQISRLGGTLNVVSAPGEGTRVSLRVPMKQ
jgi:PAS domain S-box-containing protein